jgi:hypothetical protein
VRAGLLTMLAVVELNHRTSTFRRWLLSFLKLGTCCGTTQDMNGLTKVLVVIRTFLEFFSGGLEA